MDKCREEFEAYIVTRYPKRSKEVVTRKLEEIDGYQFYTFKEIEDAWVIWQHQQAKVEELQTHAQEIHKREIKLFEKTLILTHERDELQKRVDKALQEIKGAARWINEYAIDDPDFIKGGALTALRRLEQALKGEG